MGEEIINAKDIAAKSPGGNTATCRAETPSAQPSIIRAIHIQSVPTQRLFSVGAAAQFLGISDDTLRKYGDLGQIPVYRFINGHRVFKLEDLNRLIDELPLWHDGSDDATCAGRDKEHRER